uniref:Uncharacterized protein n=1 Tax=Oryza rufipogon TaxID=4529 RepID=A0A0E0PD80_ORYRU
MGAKLQTHEEENGNIEYLNCTWPDKNHGHSLFCGVLARFQSASCNRKAAPPAVHQFLLICTLLEDVFDSVQDPSLRIPL